jgi:hypothetical protein
MSKVKVYRSQQIREWILLLTGKLFFVKYVPNTKNILSDRRQNFTPENLERYLVMVIKATLYCSCTIFLNHISFKLKKRASFGFLKHI